jgi:hypothetical protein
MNESAKRHRERRCQEQLRRNMRIVGEALDSVAGKLRRLAPSIVSALPVGRTDGALDGFTIVLEVRTNRDLQTDEKSQLIDKARPIIEERLCEQGYPVDAVSTFAYVVHYEDSARNMRAVGDVLKSVARKLGQLTPPVISTLHLGPFSGDPNGFQVTLVVETGIDLRAAEECRLIEHARPIIEERLRKRGYSIEAISTFSYILASQEDIDKAGGWHNYLR